MFRRWWIVIVALLFTAVVGISYRQIHTTITAQTGGCGTTFPWCNQDANYNILPSGAGGACQTTCCSNTVWGGISPGSTYCPYSPPGWQCVNNTCVPPAGYNPSSQQSSAAQSSSGMCSNDGECSDGLLCTTDSCVNGVCQNTTVTCSDPGECKINTCNPQTGMCETTNTQDGLSCTGSPSGCQNVCSGGSCIAPNGCGAASSTAQSQTSQTSQESSTSSRSSNSSRSSASSHSSASSRSSASSSRSSSRAAQQSSNASCTAVGTGCATCRSTGCLPNCGIAADGSPYCTGACGPGSFQWRDGNGNTCTPCTPEEVMNEPPACPTSGSSNSSRSSISSRSSVSSISRRSSLSSASRTSQSSLSSCGPLQGRSCSDCQVRNVQECGCRVCIANGFCTIVPMPSSCESPTHCAACPAGQMTCQTVQMTAYQDGTACTACTQEQQNAERNACGSSSAQSNSSACNLTGFNCVAGTPFCCQGKPACPSCNGTSCTQICPVPTSGSSNSSSSLTSRSSSSQRSGPLSSGSNASGSAGAGSSNDNTSSNASTRGSAASGSNNSGSLGSTSARSSSRQSGQSSSVSSQIGACRGDECSRGGDLFCGNLSKVCNLTNDLPCIECLDPAANSSSRGSAASGAQSNGSTGSTGSGRSSAYSHTSGGSQSSVIGACRGDECSLGGDSYCEGMQLMCATVRDLPCIQCIPNTGSASSRRSSVGSGHSSSGNGGDDSGNGGDDNPNIWYCGDGIISANEECDDRNNEGGDGCTAQCRIEAFIGLCTGRECDEGGNDVCGSVGLSCEGTNDLPCIQCVDTEGNPEEPLCNGTACSAGGETICSDYGMSCVEDSENPCFVCESTAGNSSSTAIAVMNCSGQECNDGGSEVCGAFGLRCSPSGDLPCISCINSVGAIVEPSCAKNGCAIGGSDVCSAQGLGCRAITTGACFECTNLEGTVMASASTFICGNGILEAGEQCDEGARNSDAMNALCRTNCRAGGCGDGILDMPERCDDGNTQDGDGCSQTCINERTAADNTATLPGQVVELPFLIGGSVAGNTAGNTAGATAGNIAGNGSNMSGNTAGTIRTSGTAPSTPDTGPAALAVMAAGAAAGYSWMRRKKQ